RSRGFSRSGSCSRRGGCSRSCSGSCTRSGSRGRCSCGSRSCCGSSSGRRELVSDKYFVKISRIVRNKIALQGAIDDSAAIAADRQVVEQNIEDGSIAEAHRGRQRHLLIQVAYKRTVVAEVNQSEIAGVIDAVGVVVASVNLIAVGIDAGANRRDVPAGVESSAVAHVAIMQKSVREAVAV